jgi:putative ABC transport system ATP-binding protein
LQEAAVQVLFAFEGVGLTAEDGTVVLQDVDLQVPDGGITVFEGPSGSGKSTLLRLCNRLEAPTAGRVLLRGDDVAAVPARSLRRRVGMVFQRPVVFPGSVLDNLRVAQPSLTPDEAGDALARVGLDVLVLDRDAAVLSGGEQQRTCLARTLVTGPEVLLMDEPTSALDPDATHTLEHLVRALAEAGTPVLWVSHDRSQRRRLADWVVRVEAGRVVASGPSAAEGHAHDDDGPFS